MSTFGYRKRVFLASISTGHTSYILTEVESSRGGEYKWGHCMLTMADCRRRIQLEFFLGTLRARCRLRSLLYVIWELPAGITFEDYEIDPTKATWN
jgi:hypothetical protein